MIAKIHNNLFQFQRNIFIVKYFCNPKQLLLYELEFDCVVCVSWFIYWYLLQQFGINKSWPVLTVSSLAGTGRVSYSIIQYVCHNCYMEYDRRTWNYDSSATEVIEHRLSQTSIVCGGNPRQYIFGILEFVTGLGLWCFVSCCDCRTWHGFIILRLLVGKGVFVCAGLKRKEVLLPFTLLSFNFTFTNNSTL